VKVRLSFLVACSVMSTIAAAHSTKPAPASVPAQVTVVGNDYAFVQLPATIAAGPTLFSFENRGSVRHELSIVQLKPGVTVRQVLERGPGAASSRAMAEKLIGILVVRPGESSGGQLLVDLQSGQRYLVVCTLKDTPDAQPHAQLGMIGSFDVP
jgi:hypothetical protein